MSQGVAWKIGSEGVFQLSRLVFGIVLARLLTPHEYGLAAMVLAFGALVPIFSDLALGSALIHRKRLTTIDISTVFWTTVATGLMLTSIGLLAAEPLAALFRQPEARPLFMVFSLSFIVGSLGATQLALLSRAMNFRALELRAMTATVSGAAAGVAAAAAGLGPWALITQWLTMSAVSTVLLWRFSSWRPEKAFSRSSLRTLGGYSSNVFGAHLLLQSAPSTNSFIIGRYLGPAALGAYTVSLTIILLPFYRIAAPIQQVLFPAFSRLQDDERRIAGMWLRVNRLVAAIALPALLGLIVLAPDFVPVVLGDRWSSAVPVLQVLALVGMFQSLQSLNLSILQARNRTRLLLGYSIVALAGGAAAVAFGVRWGVVGSAASFAVANVVLMPIYTWITAREVGVSLSACARNIFGVLQATLGMAVVLVPLRIMLVHEGAPPIVRLVACVVAGAFCFVVLCAWREPELRLELARLLRKRGYGHTGGNETFTPER